MIQIFLIIVLGISLLVSLAILSREKGITKILKKEIRFLETEKVALKKKNGKYFMAEARYLFIFLSHKRNIRSLRRKNINTFRNYKRKVKFLSKKNEGLIHHLHNYDAIKIEREKQYTNLN